MSIYILISFCLYFIIHFQFTQKIYSRNYFIIVLLISLIIPLVSFFQIDTDEWVMKVSALSLLLSFVIILFVVKVSYKKINELLIKRKLIKKEFEGKDFTYVFWDSILSLETWDKKLAAKPSWLDYTITYILLILPILLIVPINKIIK